MSSLISAFLARLRFRSLFLLCAGLLMLDVLVPDFVPFVDEILLAAMTLMVSRFKRESKEPPALPPATPPDAAGR